MAFKCKAIIVTEGTSKKPRTRKSPKPVDPDGSINSRAASCSEKHIKSSMLKNPAGVYIVKDGIESNGFRVAKMRIELTC